MTDRIVQALRERRQKMNIPLRIVAERAGYGQNTMWYWETGRATPSLPKLHDWAQSLGLTLTLKEARDE